MSIIRSLVQTHPKAFSKQQQGEGWTGASLAVTERLILLPSLHDYDRTDERRSTDPDPVSENVRSVQHAKRDPRWVESFLLCILPSWACLNVALNRIAGVSYRSTTQTTQKRIGFQRVHRTIMCNMQLSVYVPGL